MAKQEQEVIVASPVVLLKRPAKTTPWWDRMILAHWWRLTKAGGMCVICFGMSSLIA